MSSNTENIATCIACGCVMDVTLVQPFTNVECPDCGKHNRVKVEVGSYVLKKRQGVGGMSIVFGAVDKNLGREVAIKILNESYSMDEKRIAQFEQEAKITAAISHPHVVRVYTVGRAYDRFYIAMELVPGDSLEEKMVANGALPELEVLSMGRQVCEGLNAANQAGLIHRDIKPGNILFDAEGNVKIVDFGLALVTQGGKARAEEIWATPYYVPPETLDGREEDFRSDIYALGASLFHAITGKVPFENESKSTTELKLIKMKLPSIRSVSSGLSDATCELIDKAMAFDADDRFSSYKEIIDALHYAELVLEGKEIEPKRAVSPNFQVKSGKSRAMLFSFIAVGVIAVVGAIIAVNSGNGGEQKNGGNDEVNKALGIEGSDDGGAVGRSLAIALKEGRQALQKKDYNAAASRYSGIVKDTRFTMSSVMWAGLQGAIVNWLNGNPAGSRSILFWAEKRYKEAKDKNQLGDGSELISGVAKSIPQLHKMEKIDPSSLPGIKTDIEAMLYFASALKNWEEGYFIEADRLFESVQSYAGQQGRELSDETKVYVSLIPDYINDAEIMKRFEEVFTPNNDEEIEAQRSKLISAKKEIRTKGRAVENMEEWLIQLDLHKNRLAYERKMKAAGGADNQASNNDQEDDWDSFYKGLEKDLAGANFQLVREKLKLRTFRNADANKKKDQMIYLCERASGYLGTLSETLSKGTIQSEVKLKEGKTYDRFSSINNIGVAVPEKNVWRRVTWGEIETNSLVNLHSLSVSGGDLSQFEKNLRLEQAIAFAWLGGERDKAKAAATNLIKNSQVFKGRWEQCMKWLE